MKPNPRFLGGAVVALALALSVSSPARAAQPVHHLVVGAIGTPLIGVLGVDRDGALSSVPGSPFASGPGSLSVTITPDAKTVYTGHVGSGTILGFRLNPDGTLSRIDDALVLAGAPVVGLAITPDGSTLFATVGDGFGEVRSYAISPSGALAPTGAPAVHIAGASSLSQPAITPDAQHLLVSNWVSNTVMSFAIGPGSSLTPIGSAIPTGEKPAYPGVTPDGRFAYVSNEIGGSVSGYAIGSDGRLMPTPGSPYPSPFAHGTAVTPDSRYLYVPTSGGIGGFRIGPDGRLTPLPGSPYALGTPSRLVPSPDGRRLFVIDGLASVSTLVIEPDGSLSPSGLPSADTGGYIRDGAISYLTPNLGPVAALDVGGGGLTRSFSASASADPDGSVARYAWDFGDGKQQTTTTPNVSHRYREPGSRTITLTVTDDEGCSTQVIYNGQTVVCGGGPRAQTARRITVEPT